MGEIFPFLFRKDGYSEFWPLYLRSSRAVTASKSHLKISLLSERYWFDQGGTVVGREEEEEDGKGR